MQKMKNCIASLPTAPGGEVYSFFFLVEIASLYY